MSEQNKLVLAYEKLISKHYSAVQTDTALDYTDSWKAEQKAKQFWNDFYALEKEFVAMLENIHANG
jgi:hypothetical protein